MDLHKELFDYIELIKSYELKNNLNSAIILLKIIKLKKRRIIKNNHCSRSMNIMHILCYKYKYLKSIKNKKLFADL